MQNKVITSVSNKFIKDLLQKTEDKKSILRSGLLLVEGKNNIKEAMDKGLIVYLFVLNESDTPDDIIVDTNKIIHISSNVMKKLSSLKNFQNYIAIINIPFYDIKEKFNNVVFLDQIQDPSNLGSIIRSSIAFGVEAIYISKNSVFAYNQKVINSSQGAIFKLPIFQVDLLTVSKNYNLYTTSLGSNSKKINEISFENPTALVFGNEGNGVSEDLVEEAKENFLIPISNFDSLNLSVAASISIYELMKNRKIK